MINNYNLNEKHRTVIKTMNGDGIVKEGSRVTKEFMAAFTRALYRRAEAIDKTDGYTDAQVKYIETMTEAYELLNPGYELIWTCSPDEFVVIEQPKDGGPISWWGVANLLVEENEEHS